MNRSATAAVSVQNACVEGAIKIINGKARLVSETCCDGLGACLGKCPQDAITVEEREALPFNEEAAKQHAHASIHEASMRAVPERR